jgi:hypothetical protein
MASKPSNSGSTPSFRIACYGTAFLIDHPVDAAALKDGIARELPQFSSPRLDASFLINCGRFLGKLTTTETPSRYVKRVAGSDFRSPKATAFYQCSTELCVLLAAVTAERAAEIDTEWYGMYGRVNAKAPKAKGRTQWRLETLKHLAALAKQVTDSETKLMLRVDYRTNRQVDL